MVFFSFLLPSETTRPTAPNQAPKTLLNTNTPDPSPPITDVIKAQLVSLGRAVEAATAAAANGSVMTWCYLNGL